MRNAVTSFSPLSIPSEGPLEPSKRYSEEISQYINRSYGLSTCRAYLFDFRFLPSPQVIDLGFELALSGSLASP